MSGTDAAAAPAPKEGPAREETPRTPPPKRPLPEQLWLLERLIRDFGMKHWRGYAIALSFMALTAAMTGLSAWIMQDVINEIFVEKRAEMVGVIAGGVALIFIVKGGASYVQAVVLARVGNAVVAEIQMRMFDHIQRQRVDFFERFGASVLSVRMSQNAKAAREAVDLVVTSMGRDLFTVIALGIVMIVQDPLLAAIALLLAPPVAYGEWVLVRKIKAIVRSELLSMARIIGTVQETVRGSRVVKAFGLEPRMRGEMEGAVDGVRERANRIAKVKAAANPLVETFGGLAIAGVILYGGWRVIEGGGDPGAFFSFITALLMAYEPAKRLARLNISLQASLVAVEMMYTLLDIEPDIREAPDARDLAVSEGEVRFHNVSFRYGDQSAALRRLSFTAPPGKVTAIVGPSGAGKSTIVGLIERFYDPYEGHVLIDGMNVAQASFASLRRAVSYVGQDAFLFDGTVIENILMGREGAQRWEAVEAAKSANAHAFIERLPKGYDTPLGEDGATTLSGGERQRIAIARAMLKGAPILVLDEPTSALDSQTEAQVTEALGRLMRGRTTIVIAHRLQTVRHADVIHVLNRGRLVESGTHEELKAAGGLYARLHGLQMADA